MAGQQVGTTLEIRISADCAALRGVRAKVVRFAEGCGLDPTEIDELSLAVTEALANVIEHGYGGPCEKPIDIALSRVVRGGRQGVAVRVRDWADRVDPDRICGRDLDDVRPGGLGVHIIRSVMDEVTYAAVQDDDCGMILTMVKLARA